MKITIALFFYFFLNCFSNNTFEGNYKQITIGYKKKFVAKQFIIKEKKFNLYFSPPKYFSNVNTRELKIFSKKNIKNSDINNLLFSDLNNFFVFRDSKVNSFCLLKLLKEKEVVKLNNQLKQNKKIIHQKFLLENQKINEFRMFLKPYFLVLIFVEPIEKNKVPFFIYAFNKKYFQREVNKIQSSVASIRLKKISIFQKMLNKLKD